MNDEAFWNAALKTKSMHGSLTWSRHPVRCICPFVGEGMAVGLCGGRGTLSQSTRLQNRWALEGSLHKLFCLLCGSPVSPSDHPLCWSHPHFSMGSPWLASLEGDGVVQLFLKVEFTVPGLSLKGVSLPHTKLMKENWQPPQPVPKA